MDEGIKRCLNEGTRGKKMNREEDGSFARLRALFGVDISSWL